MIDKIYKLYNVKDKSEYRGLCKKYECTIKGEHGIFKERLNSASKDHVVEAIVYNIAQLCNVDCAFAKVRKANGVIGIFSRFEIEDNVKFTHANKIYGTAEMFIEDLFKRTIQISGGVDNSFIYTLYKYIVFDYLVGQMDRHLENLAIIKDGKRIYWYKLYDNGLALQSHLGNETAIGMLKNGTYSSRMGNDREIMKFISDRTRESAYGINCIDTGRMDLDTIYSIINNCDVYNEIIKERKIEMAKFVVRQAMKLNEVWGGDNVQK